MSSADPLAKAWLALSSLRTTAILAIALALMAGIAGLVPQGQHAIELAKLDHSEDVRRLVAWGISDIFDSQWIRALAVLLLANILAVITRSKSGGLNKDQLARVPAEAPHKVSLNASLPERAVEALRENFRIVLGTSPIVEDVQGSKVTLVFETSRRAELAPLLTHLGLIVLVVGAGLSTRPPPVGQSTVHATLAVSDPKSQTTGYFNMAANEAFEFFRTPGKYTIRSFSYSRLGLGPAVMLEWARPEGQREVFWVFKNAPKDFDKRHRKNALSIEGISMGVAPLPGQGLASSTSSSLLILGLGLLCFGAFSGNRADGRLWIEANGDEVQVVGVPRTANDPRFGASFRRWAVVAQAVIKD